jgi:hypothetical protein
VSFIIDDTCLTCIVNPNLSVCHMWLLFLTLMMMMVNKTSVCIIPVFKRQSDSSDVVSFVQKIIIFYIVLICSGIHS